MNSQVSLPTCTPNLSRDIDGFSVSDEKSVSLKNTSINVENSTVHIGNVIHHHHHIPTSLDESTDDSSAPNDNELSPEKTYESQDEPTTKLDYFIKNKKISFTVSFVFVATLMAGVILLLYLTRVPDADAEAPPKKEDDDGDDDHSIVKPSYSFGNLTKLDDCRIFEEEDWGYERNLGDIELKHPVPLIIISHSATPICKTIKACKDRTKQMQEYHISRGSPDIGYNFVIGGDGNIYVGRGWNARNFHLGNHSIGINFVGNFFRDELSPKMIRCAKAVIAYGVESNIMENDYKLVCHNQTNAKLSSPGPNVYAEVKKWPHFMEGAVSWNFLYGT